MHDTNPLGRMILSHWRKHHPQMLADLQSDHGLERTLHDAQERAGNLLYELTCVKKMDYQAAWELTMREWAFPSSGDRPRRLSTDSKPNRKKPPPATSG